MKINGKNEGFPIARAGRAELITAHFNPSMLATAREAKGLTQTALAKMVGISQPMIGKWESGLASPSDEQIDLMANELGVDSRLFFVDRSRRLASLSDFYHRSLAKAKRSDVKAIHARCSIMDIQVDRLLQIGELPEDRIPDIDPNNHAGNTEKIAMMVRAAMGVDRGPVQNLVALIERAGGMVIDRDLEVDDVEALCRWVPELPKLFFINGAKPADRTRFSLAHELGHTVMHFGRDESPDLAEKQANSFAAAFLMPGEEIRHDLRQPLTLQSLATLKRKWKVSMQALIMRAYSLGLIEERRRTSLFIQLSRNGWKKTEPVELPRESPSHFARLVATHIEAGYTEQELAQLLFVNEDHIKQILTDCASPTAERDGVRLRLIR